MKIILRTAIAAAAFVWASMCHADDIRTIPPGDDVIVALKKGEPAPFAGQLFDINTSLRWANWLAQYKDKVEADELKARALCLSELSFQQDLSDADLYRAEELNIDLKKRLTKSEQGRLQAEHERDNPAWYKSVWFGVVLGTVSTAAAVLIGSQVF